MIIPDYLIIDEIKRREEKSWEPETLQLPLYIPSQGPEIPREDRLKKERSPNNGVIIIDMNTYTRLL